MRKFAARDEHDDEDLNERTDEDFWAALLEVADDELTEQIEEA